MSFFDKAKQIQLINAELEKLKLDLDSKEKEILIKNNEYDALNSGLDDYKAELNSQKKELLKEIEDLKEKAKEEEKDIRELKKEKDNLLKEIEKAKAQALKDKDKINNLLKSANKELLNLAQEIDHYELSIIAAKKELNDTLEVNASFIKKNNELLESIKDSERFIKNLVIREQILSQREARLNKKLCQDSK